MTSPVTGAEAGPLRATASAAAKAGYMLDASVAADCRARCAVLLDCHPLCQARSVPGVIARALERPACPMSDLSRRSAYVVGFERS
jgi:hypothetical protein